jgi:hypothetical protein
MYDRFTNRLHHKHTHKLHFIQKRHLLRIELLLIYKPQAPPYFFKGFFSLSPSKISLGA